MGSPPLPVSVVACLTPSASVLGKSADKTAGLPPQYLEEAETWQSLGYETGETGSPSGRVVFLIGVCRTLPVRLHTPSGVSQRQMRG